jgi:hypothetical protein
MGSCEFKTRCKLHQIFESKEALDILKLVYCEGDFFRCEIYKCMKGNKSAPKNLLPDGSLFEYRTGNKNGNE